MQIRNITIEDYSEKSILVSGIETKEYKDFFKSIHGRYIPTLKGWIFSRKHKDLIIRRLNSKQHENI